MFASLRLGQPVVSDPSRLMLAFALTVPWWIAFYPLPFLEFYKEWTFAVALALAAFTVGRAKAATLVTINPAVLAASAMAAAALLQATLYPELIGRAVLIVGYMALFVTASMLGDQLTIDVDKGLATLAFLLLSAALGTCLAASLQLNKITFDWPLVATNAGNRLSGNLAQANHYVDLLWLGSLSAAGLAAMKRISWPVATACIALILPFAVLSGSRMALVFASASGLIGAATLYRSKVTAVRHLAISVLVVAISFPVIDSTFSKMGVPEFFGLTTVADRIADPETERSTGLRLWFFKAGATAAAEHPFFGVGIGRFVGYSLDLAMKSPGSPAAAAEANAHNLLLHLAAELGLPVMLFVAGCLIFWWLDLWRRAIDAPGLCILLLVTTVLCHSFLEYPLWYTYFLGTLGLLAGLGRRRGGKTLGKYSSLTMTVFSTVVLVAALVAYAHFRHLEAAMAEVVVQVSMGAVPQPAIEIDAALSALPNWTPYVEYAESIRLITAKPEASNAKSLSDRCVNALSFAPSPYLIARCAAIHQVAKEHERTRFFVNSFCKLYPTQPHVLADSARFVALEHPEALLVASGCGSGH